MTRHRHSGPQVRYKTKRGRIMHRERPLHPITRQRKKENRRDIRRKSFEEEVEEGMDMDDEEIKEINRSAEEIVKRKEAEEEDEEFKKEFFSIDDDELAKIAKHKKSKKEEEFDKDFFRI